MTVRGRSEGADKTHEAILETFTSNIPAKAQVIPNAKRRRPTHSERHLPRTEIFRTLKLKIRQHECNQDQNNKHIARAHDIARLFANTQVARKGFRSNAHVPGKRSQQQQKRDLKLTRIQAKTLGEDNADQMHAYDQRQQRAGGGQCPRKAGQDDNNGRQHQAQK